MAAAAILKVTFLAITYRPILLILDPPAKGHVILLSDFSEILYENAERHVNKG